MNDPRSVPTSAVVVFQRALDAAYQAGYLSGLTAAERALYGGREALYDLLRILDAHLNIKD